jgi:hypothetical protein
MQGALFCLQENDNALGRPDTMSGKRGQGNF